MIIVQLAGGLGNQMFQYAAGRRLAYIRKTELKLDISDCETDPLRSYALNVFNIKERFANPSEITKAIFGKRSLLEKAVSKILRKKPKRASTFIKEKHFHVDHEILNLPDGVYLDGYWQSEKYFKDIEEIIRREFTIKIFQTGKNKDLAEMIKTCESVSLHIRRGDYVAIPSITQKHGFCKIDYYQRCVQMISQKVDNPRFFLFSDDPKWVKDNFKINYPLTVVDHNNADNAHEDLRLMTQCKHNVIANSTLSWWGAWLNPNPDKIVFAPKKWFGNNMLSDIDLILSNWLKI